MAEVTLVIPARRGSTRFPGKPLASLRGADGRCKPLVQWVLETAKRVAGVSKILVATDDCEIADSVTALGHATVLTSPACRNGSERCAEAVGAVGIDHGIIVNLQGDAPLTPPAAIEALIAVMQDDSAIAVASPMLRCSPATLDRLVEGERRGMPGGTTVVVDRRGDALYFSRRLLPWFAGDPGDAPIYMHLGVYAYRRDALLRYAAAPPCEAEKLEGLEQLRFLDIGIPIRMVEIAEPAGGLWEVNYPDDVALVEAGLRERVEA